MISASPWLKAVILFFKEEKFNILDHEKFLVCIFCVLRVNSKPEFRILPIFVEIERKPLVVGTGAFSNISVVCLI